jgi:pimeloyl-ACP methyl ester carboxylesterase
MSSSASPSSSVPTLHDRESSIALPGGRTMSYVSLGTGTGSVVFVLDGPGSRGLARALSLQAGPLDVRVVAPDRPGFFGTTPAARAQHSAVAADVLVLADELGAERFGIVGQSGGTPFALALAAAAPERVLGVAFCGGLSPLGERDALQDVAGPMRTPFKLAGRAPWLLRPLFKAAARQVLKDPKKAAEKFAAGAPPADRRALDRPELWALHEQVTGEAMRYPGAFAVELRALAQPWDVDLARITAPVAFWVGDRDVTHPPVMSHKMAERLGGAPVHVVPDAMTFGLVDRYADVLAFAARA